MTTTLPTPSPDLEYTNSETGDKFKYDAVSGAWVGFEGIDVSGDTMTGTIAYPDMSINGGALTSDNYVENAGEWNTYTTGVSGVLTKGIAYGNGTWVAVGSGGGVAYSKDGGINWNKAPSVNESNQWYSVAYGNGKFVAVAQSGTNRVMYSTNGINWYTISGKDSVPWRGITYGGGKFVAVGNESTNPIMYSTNGTSWTQPAVSGKGSYWYSVAYGDGKFVAVNWLTSKQVLYSYDAINWETGTITGSGKESRWNSVTYAEDKNMWVAVSNSGSDNKTMYSVDGINWQTGSAPAPNTILTDVAYGNGKFIAISSSACLFSEDGINWTSDEDTSIRGYAIAYANGTFLSGTSSWTKTFHSVGDSRLYFNGNPVVINRGQTKALARSVSNLSSRLGGSRYYQSEEPSDSSGIDNGTLWLNPSNAKLSIYHDSDWNQLN